MQYLKYIVLMMLIAGVSYGQNIVGQSAGDLRFGHVATDKEYLAGEHTPLEYSISGTVSGTGSLVFYTPWFQIGVADDADRDDNVVIQRYNPEYFTLGLLLAKYGAGDSAGVSDAKVQYALTPTDTLITVTLACDENDTSAVGDLVEGDATGASCIITSITAGTDAGDSVIVGYMYPGGTFNTTTDSLSINGDTPTMDISAATYTNTGVIELADSSNTFIASGVYSHAQYGTWRFLNQARTDVTVQYSIRAFGAAYCRFYVACDDIADTTTVSGKMRTEH